MMSPGSGVPSYLRYQANLSTLSRWAELSPQFGVAVRAAETGAVVDVLVGHQSLQRINSLLAGHTHLSDRRTEALHTEMIEG